MSISGFFQFILGFILGVLLLAAGSVGAAYYFFNRMASAPPQPVFEETLPQAQEPEAPAEEPVSETEDSTNEPDATVAEAEEEETEEEDEIPVDAYSAKVTWSSGLSLRANPNAEAERIGGVDYNEEILVIGESDDKVWQKIRTQGGQEAWVKAGNVARVN